MQRDTDKSSKRTHRGVKQIHVKPQQILYRFRSHLCSRFFQNGRLRGVRRASAGRPRMSSSSGGCGASAASSTQSRTATSALQRAAARVVYSRNIDFWRKRLPLLPSEPQLGSWFISKRKGGVWGLGCIACSLAQSGGAYGRWGVSSLSSMELRKFVDHAATKNHRSAVAALTGSPPIGPTVPSVADFEVVLGDRLARKSYRSGDLTSSSPLKSQKMMWCLSEALLARDRKFMTDSKAIAIHQDACAPRLLVRYCVSNSKFEVRRGFLGLAKNFGTTSNRIVDATSRVVDLFCTKYHGAPGAPKVAPSLDRALRTTLVASVRVFDADGASDEQRAGRLLAERLFPNTVAIIKDKAHASRRLTSRPWSADPFLSALLDRYIQKPGSIVHTIQNSPDIAHVYQRHCSLVQNCPINGSKVRNLQFAKHRFDSTSRPLGRFVLLFDAVWATATELMISRAGRTPAKVAREFLEDISAEHVFALALLADAGHEMMALTRYHDTEDLIAATISSRRSGNKCCGFPRLACFLHVTRILREATMRRRANVRGRISQGLAR